MSSLLKDREVIYELSFVACLGKLRAMLGTTVLGDIHILRGGTESLGSWILRFHQRRSHQATKLPNDSLTFSLINVDYGNNLDIFSGSRHYQPFESWPALVRPVGWVSIVKSWDVHFCLGR
jgi:hypothetical protein